MKLMFYCQHILGIGHLIRSMEIVRGLNQDFQVYFINGGEIVENFQVPVGVEVINLPAIKTDAEFQSLQVDESFGSVDEVLELRKQIMLDLLDGVQPDVLVVELFPFGRGRFAKELVPLLEAARAIGTKTVSSLRDIVVTKVDRDRYEEKVCRLVNRHFDMVLVHGDPQFMPLETSFASVEKLTCPVHYTGYVVQPIEELPRLDVSCPQPMILTSVGGGRFGHELLRTVAQTAKILADQIPHHFQLFTGPFCPDSVFDQLHSIAQITPNLTVDRYTPNLLHYMEQADLSISMAGYNTTMNILTTGIPAMLLPFTGNDDQEQRIRSQRLEELGLVSVIRSEDLHPDRFAQRVMAQLQSQPALITFDLAGVQKTAGYLRSLVKSAIAA